MFEEVSEITGSSEQMKRDFNFKKYGYVTYCFLCEKGVKTINLRCHLYFGHVKCENCGKVTTSCLKFRNLNISRSEDDGKCNHSNLDWIFNPVNHLKSLLEEDEETFDEYLIQYLKSLKVLKKIEPYKDAITHCKKYLKAKKYSKTNKKFFKLGRPLTVTVCNTFIPIITLPTASTSYVNRTTTQIKEEKTSLSLIEKYTDSVTTVFPKNGFYFISKKVVEECPNCYEPLNPQSMKFNTKNCLISTSCKECFLLVFFLLDPPDGSEPKFKMGSEGSELK
ncbi:UNVERIFIED_CONTAM: hypothetical protein RMT77_011828 [Armadillidium vulgare]